MSKPPLFQKAIRFEILKTLLILTPIVIGGIIFVVFVPLSENIDWIDFLFYSIVGSLIILSQIISHFYKMKRIKEMQTVVSSVVSGLQNSTPSTFTSTSSSVPKEAIKIDEYAVAYCPTCGKSFTKKYKFCPSCGSCKIKGMI